MSRARDQQRCEALSAAAVEHPIVAAVRLRAKRRVLWMREVWGRLPTATHLAAIQNEEVDYILSDRASSQELEANFYANDPQIQAITETLALAESQLTAAERWQMLAGRFGLGGDEMELLALAVAVALDPHLAKVCAYLHDQPEMAYATPWLAAALYGPGRVPVRLDQDSALLRWLLLRRLVDNPEAQGPLAGYAADAQTAAWLVQGGEVDLPSGCHVFSVRKAAQPVLYPELLASMQAFVQTTRAAKTAVVEIELAGAPGSGRRTLAAQLAKALRQPLLVVDAGALPHDPTGTSLAQVMVAARRAVRLRNAILYWCCAPEGVTLEPEASQPVPTIEDGLLIVGRTRRSAGAARDGTVFRGYVLPPLTLNARLALWGSLSSEVPPRQVREWRLTPGEVVRVRQVAAAGDEAIAQACRRPIESSGLLTRLALTFSRGSLVLPDHVMRQLDDLEQQVRLRWEVYEDWGFGRLCPNGRGIVALFAGPSGTGKTMAAQVLARSLGMELYRLDPANVVNKYIGETEKRLKLVFDESDNGNFLLLIDECEGLFGQRFSSKDAHDRYANLEIDYLLQRLECFEGVAILASNRKNDVDSAFQRRLRVVIDFLPPDPPERRRLWRLAFNADDEAAAALLEPLDWDALAERITLTGAEIKLAALNAAFLARAAGERIAPSHVLTSVRRELAKRGQTLRGFE